MGGRCSGPEPKAYSLDRDVHDPYEEGAGPNSALNHEGNGNGATNDNDNPFTDIEEKENRDFNCYIIKESYPQAAEGTDEGEEEEEEDEEDVDGGEDDSGNGDDDGFMNTSNLEV